jgi:hypothetical protein
MEVLKMSLVIDLDIITRKSAESTILDVSFTSSGFVFHCILPDLFEDQLLVSIDNPILEIHIVSEFIFLGQNKCYPIHPCFFRLINLNDVLEINEWGYYIPPNDKKSFFGQIKKNKCTLAYGKHSSKYNMLFLIEPNIFQALIHNQSNITAFVREH